MEFIELAEAEEDESLTQEVESEVKSLKKAVEDL
jgi:hypothetical protein